MTDRTRWAIATAALFAAVALVVWLLTTRPPSMHWLFRLYEDKHLLKETVRSWGWLAPLGFIAIQALQVIISPIPGEVTGPVGGALFGTFWAVAYSTIGLPGVTLFAFWVGLRGRQRPVRAWL